MKLVIRQYLASLKERGELDALLPDLLSQMGLEVFLKPGIGSRQYGVDVGAYGQLSDESESKVYLFSVKSGDLGRKDWDSGSLQDLRPSIIEMIDVFIPTRIPVEYQGHPVEICLCFGGEVKEEVRENVTLFLKKQQSKELTFSEWNGDRLATLIENHLLREELLPVNCRSLLRKSLAMLDDPEVSFKNFRELAYQLTCTTDRKPVDILTSIRQLYLCLWILYSWCRDEDKLESAYLSCEYSLLNSWEATKFAFGKKNRTALSALESLQSIQLLSMQVFNEYLERKIIPHVGNLYALSHAVKPSCSVDVNLKLFDVLGRIALAGCWSYWYLDKVDESDTESVAFITNSIFEYEQALKKLIVNNPILFTPYRDEQAIDISIALWFLAMNKQNWNDINAWLSNMSRDLYNMLKAHDKYPSNIQSYAELIEHPTEKTEEYRRTITKGSVLYPLISAFSAILKLKEPYETIGKIKEEFLPHCNFQIFFLDESSEQHFYRFDNVHGATLSDVCITEPPEAFIQQLLDECEQSSKIFEMSAPKYSFWPLIFVGCRHYRLPLPPHFIVEIWKRNT